MIQASPGPPSPLSAMCYVDLCKKSVIKTITILIIFQQHITSPTPALECLD